MIHPQTGLGIVLLADPHWVIRASLERTLRHAGAIDVCVVADLTGALSVLDRPFDLIVTELCFEDGGADSLVRLARNAERPPAIVAMAVRARIGARIEVPEGVDTFLFKPFTSDQMLDAIARAQISRRRRFVERTDNTEVVPKKRYHVAKDDMLMAMVDRELRNNGGSIRGTALALGISRTTVRRLIARSTGQVVRLRRVSG